MSRKRKKNKGNPAGGTNPSNGLYEHPSVAAARGRKDADTPGGVPEASKPRRNRRRVPTGFLLTIVLFIGMLLLLPRAQFFMTAGVLIAGGLAELVVARLLREPWDINRAGFWTIIFAFSVFTSAGIVAIITLLLSTP